MLLCDYAEAIDGKLYIMGGAWAIQHTPNLPFSSAVAAVVSVEWNETNVKHEVVIELRTEDGAPVNIPGTDQPLALPTQLEVGRPPGSKHGMRFNAPLVFNVQGLALAEGGYEWVLTVDGMVKARSPFYVGA